MVKKKALVLGAGPMGLWMARHLAERGYHVTVYDKDRKKLRNLDGGRISAAKNLTEALNNSALIVLAIGSSSTVDLLPRLISKTDGKTFFDISSVKTPIAKALARSKIKNNVVALVHPLFGPGAKKLNDKYVVLTPFRRPAAEYRVCREIFHPCTILRMSVTRHDWVMASAMALPRLLMLTLLNGWRMEKVKPLTVSQRALLVAAAPILSESPTLFREIIEKNPYTRQTLSKTIKTLHRMRKKPSTASSIFKRFRRRIGFESYFKIYKLLEDAASNSR
ncbi:MAG: prephenate dehydrogenase/arogenate dehydrogenase family protein [Candidatus Caldarchaeum sp.]